MKLRPFQVLLVDDDNGALKLMNIILRRGGFEVETASDGFQALEKLKNYCPDLIITDDMMPGMNGKELAVQIRDYPKRHHISIVLYANSIHLNYDYLLLLDTFTAFLPKPVVPQEFVQKARFYALHGLVRNLVREDSTQNQSTLIYNIAMDGNVLTQMRLVAMEVMLNDMPALAEFAFFLLVDDTVDAVRKQVAKYLRHFINEESCQNLLMLLHDKDEFVALEASKSLIYFSHFPIYKQVLDVVFQTENTEVLAHLVKVLSMSDESFVLHGLFDELIEQVATSQNKEESRASSILLDGIGSWSAHEITRQVLSRWDTANTKTYQALAMVLKRYPDDALLPHLLVDAQADTVYPAVYACYALAAYNQLHVTQTLLTIATNPKKDAILRSAAILALSEHQDPDVYPTLQRMFQQVMLSGEVYLVASLTRAVIQSNERQSYGTIEQGLNHLSSVVRRTIIEEMRVANTDAMFDLMKSYISTEPNASTVMIMKKILDSEKVRQIFHKRAYFQKE